ncbi:hypothetical protein JCM21900_000604 [Sporobolomyces salmonicolor]
MDDVHLAALSGNCPVFEFKTPESKESALVALTHSSFSAVHNNTGLSKVGSTAAKAEATEALFLTTGLLSGEVHNQLVLDQFTTKNLAVIAKRIKLGESIRVGKGVSVISDDRYARALEALLGVVKLYKGPEELLRVVLRLQLVRVPKPEQSEGAETEVLKEDK